MLRQLVSVFRYRSGFVSGAQFYRAIRKVVSKLQSSTEHILIGALKVCSLEQYLKKQPGASLLLDFLRIIHWSDNKMKSDQLEVSTVPGFRIGKKNG